MTDNVDVVAGVYTALVAADELADADLGTVKVQYVKLMDGALGGSAKLGIDSSGRLTVVVSGTPAVSQSGAWNVGVSSLPALPTGANVIGAVTQSGTWTVTASGTVAATQSGAWSVDVASLPALPAGANVIGGVTQSGTWTVTASGTVAATQSGTWNVGVSSLPALPAGANVIGGVTQSGTWTVTASGTVAATQSGTWNVGVTSLPALPAGSNAIGTVTAVGNVAAGSAVSGNPVQVAGSDGTNVRRILTDTGGRAVVNVNSLPSIPAGANVIGAVTQSGTWTVGVSSLPALPAGANVIGGVTQSGTWTVTASGTVAATQSGTWNVGVTSLPALPAGSNAIGTVTAVGNVAAGSAVSGNPVLTAGSDGTNARTILTDTGGRQVVNVNSLPSIPAGANVIGAVTQSGTWTVGVSSLPALPTGANVIGAVTQSGTWTVTASGTVTAVGNVAAGSAVSGNPVQVAASDGTNVRRLLSDTSGRLMMVGAGASGAAVAGNPVLMAGSDGTNARTMLTDGGGRQRITGQVDNGTTTNGAPVLVGGHDGTNARFALVDTSGRFIVNVNSLPALPTGANVIGAVTQSGTWTVTASGTVTAVGNVAAGSAVSGNPVQVAASDGTNVRRLLSDTSGRLMMVGAGASGAAVAGNPVLMAGSDGTNVQPLSTDTNGVVRVEGVVNQVAGTIAALNAYQEFQVDGSASVHCQIGGTWVGTVLFQASMGTSWGDVPCYALPSGISPGGTVSTTTANGSFFIAPAGINKIRAIFISYTSGSATVKWTGNMTPIAPAELLALQKGDGAIGDYGFLMAGSDGSVGRLVLSDTSGRQIMVGAAASGAAVAGNPVLMAGSDGTNAQTILTDTGGRQVVNVNSLPALPTGANVIGAVTQSGTWTVTASGTMTVVGNVAEGSAVSGNPVQIAGDDGTNVRRIQTDSSGRQIIVGAAADGTARSGNPLLCGGSDGTYARYFQVDATGRQLVVVDSLPSLPTGTNTIGKVEISGVVVVAGSDGTVNRVIATDTTGQIKLAAATDPAAMADGFANPTVGHIASPMMLFNGSTWDRARGMSGNLTTGDTGAKTASGSGATQTNVGNKGVVVTMVISAASGTSPTCVFKLQGSANGGTNWYDIPNAVTASLTAAGNWSIQVYPGCVTVAGNTTSGNCAISNSALPRTWRVVWTIGGTTPSFTIGSIAYNYLPN